MFCFIRHILLMYRRETLFVELSGTLLEVILARWLSESLGHDWALAEWSARGRVEGDDCHCGRTGAALWSAAVALVPPLEAPVSA